MLESKIDLRHLMNSSTMSPDVAARLFSAVEHVEVDIMKTSATTDSGSLASDIIAAHSLIEELLRTTPDKPAIRNFLAMTSQVDVLCKICRSVNPL